MWEEEARQMLQLIELMFPFINIIAVTILIGKV